MPKKMTGGEGWKIIPAEPVPLQKEIKFKPPEQQKAKISVEKRKKGKTVTVITGLVINDNTLKELAKSLKIACGTGGAVSNAEIELQGDFREKVREWLKTNNWGLR